MGLGVLKTPSDELQRDHHYLGSPSPSDPEHSDSSEGSDSEDAPEFMPEDCLFCSNSSSTLEENVLHMHKAHGLFIPDRDRLIVDLEALVRYLHLVIFAYRECLYCHSQRASATAAQQHMIGKGHCKFDISNEGSEFADFYADATTPDQHDEVDEVGGDASLEEARGVKTSNPVLKIDDATVRLPSGKLLSHRSAAQALQSRHQYRTTMAQLHPQLPPSSPEGPSTQPASQPAQEASTSTALAKSAKREASLALELENLSAGDRAALIHLPATEQRSLLAVQKRELGRAKRAEKRFWSRVEMMGNTVKRSTFRNDEPGHDGRRRWGV